MSMTKEDYRLLLQTTSLSDDVINAVIAINGDKPQTYFELLFYATGLTSFEDLVPGLQVAQAMSAPKPAGVQGGGTQGSAPQSSSKGANPPIIYDFEIEDLSAAPANPVNPGNTLEDKVRDYYRKVAGIDADTPITEANINESAVKAANVKFFMTLGKIRSILLER
ncbi:MAG: hypothetical protein KBS66_03495 [Eubacterium sp.]|nr:hypothetical protein [Candidatus Colimonas fimequi]